MVGQVHFDIEGDHLESFDTHVDIKHRRQGVATAMYNWAKELGNDIVASSKLLPDGNKFWQGSRNKTKVWENDAEKNISARQAVDEVAIDNYAGAGSTPNNQNVDYMGLRVLMKPSTFLQLAAPLSSAPDVGLVKYIANGGAIGAPFLQIDIPEGWDTGDFAMPAQVTGHEGRNRMHAIQQLEGDEPIEVHIFPRYYRARHMTPEFVKNINSRLQVETGVRIKSGPLFTPLPASVVENFANGRGPGRPGDSQRHGIPKGATMAQLEKASRSKGRKGQLARWQLNMRRGHKK
jgi:hypothetical protein